MCKRRLTLYKEQLLTGLVLACWRLLARIPLGYLAHAAWLSGRLLWWAHGRERIVTETNLRLCYPELSTTQQTHMARASLVASSATFLELGFAWQAPLSLCLASIQRVEGLENLQQAQTAGQGVIILAPHIGNWEILNLWLSQQGVFTAMYAPPKLTSLDKHTRAGRERGGAQLVPTDVKGVAALLKALKRGEMIGILPDQEPDWSGGVFAPFFQQPAFTGTLLAKLVARTQARVVTGMAERLPHGQGFVVKFFPADDRVYAQDETTACTGINACVETAIAQAPLQYQWEYKRFRKRPTQQPSLYPPT
ncbi:KDO2-lipid IV(A) lauroyltransferase [Allopseudospirillum japonicum]|uniref:KDO2-lipid IV(A) lauroyltransferase n=1 Tax=Allopseudospirillum japonicum TaxID=64971 RepID=A0A1H6RC47_9GAMM|nr:lysophospholipid acyltransferase family protein [Allopseudospirillum japonicum]SEI52066.1 KDO2-lipid IV(A) lauroyltransferase [Allopseudospirillum japonicum]